MKGIAWPLAPDEKIVTKIGRIYMDVFVAEWYKIGPSLKIFSIIALESGNQTNTLWKNSFHFGGEIFGMV